MDGVLQHFCTGLTQAVRSHPRTYLIFASIAAPAPPLNNGPAAVVCSHFRAGLVIIFCGPRFTGPGTEVRWHSRTYRSIR